MAAIMLIAVFLLTTHLSLESVLVDSRAPPRPPTVALESTLLMLTASKNNETGQSNSSLALTKKRFKRDPYLSQVYTVEDLTVEDKGDGDPIPISNWEHCETEECTISQTFTHTVTVTSTWGSTMTLNAGQVFSVALQFSQSKAVAEGKATSYSFKLDSPGVGRLMFTPKIYSIRGLLVKDARSYCGAIIAASIFTLGMAAGAEQMPGVNCFGRHEDRQRFELLAPIRNTASVSDQIEGTWWVDYKPDPNPVDDRNFHIIRHKDIPGLIDLYNFRSGSPLMCAKATTKRGQNFAVWRAGTCYMKRTEDGRGLLTTRFAKPIGYYNIPIPNSKSSSVLGDRDEWVRKGECDLIQEYDGYGYYCKSFSDSNDMVMMFRKSDKFLGAAGDESRSNATYHPD